MSAELAEVRDPETELEPTGDGKKAPREIVVRFNSVTKRFGAKVAVDNVSLRIKKGAIYGLIGPNGAGKTTSFSMMAGYLAPTQGDVEILGHAPTNVDGLRGRLGVLPQDALLPGADRVGEFLVHMARLQGMPKAKAEESARAALEEVEGKEWWMLRCSTLSHGMSKRVALAQALLGEPEVILLDEPTAGLDPKVAYEVRQIIKRRRGKTTVVISSHNLQELEEICTAAAVLDRGRLVASGAMSELTAASSEVRIEIQPPLGASSPYKGENLPLAAIQQVVGVSGAQYDEIAREILIAFERSKTDAETVIGASLWILLQERTRISSVGKGRGLEQRVMDLTE